MSSLVFQKATKKRSKLRMAIDGPSGSGKTYTALIAAKVMAEGGRIAVIDTERGSASLYSDKFDFDVLEIEHFNPQVYVDAIHAAEDAGYSVVIIDSLSHAWEGEGGALDLVDRAAARNRGNSYVAWREVTPLHRKLVDTMLQSPLHIVATMRSKMDYSMEKDNTGKTVIRKVGMAPIQRQGIEYEFTVVGDMDIDHNMVVSKSRCESVADMVVKKPGEDFFKRILDWLNSGEEPTHRPGRGNGRETVNNRPYAPEVLRERLLLRSGAFRGKEATGKQRELVQNLLEACFLNGDGREEVLIVLQYLFSAETLQEVSDPLILVMLNDWLKPAPDGEGGYLPEPLAATEVEGVYNESQRSFEEGI